MNKKIEIATGEYLRDFYFLPTILYHNYDYYNYEYYKIIGIAWFKYYVGVCWKG